MNHFNYRCPYEPYCFRAPQFSYVRLLHAVPGAPAVDVYANDRPIANNLAYRAFTQYLPLLPGNYSIKIYPAGQKNNPVLNQNISIAANKILTAAVTGKLPNISLLEVGEPTLKKQPGKAYLRFVHLSPDAPAVDLTLEDGKKLFSEVQYRENTDYIPQSPGTMTLQLRLTGKDQVVLSVPKVTLKPGNFYTAYAVGLAEGKPSLQMLLPLDGISYINTK
ncbi:MAG: DUF4397 domain-containing protein [Bacillota bacterium]